MLSKVKNKSFQADFVLDSIVPPVSVLDCSLLGGTQLQKAKTSH